MAGNSPNGQVPSKKKLRGTNQTNTTIIQAQRMAIRRRIGRPGSPILALHLSPPPLNARLDVSTDQRVERLFPAPYASHAISREPMTESRSPRIFTADGPPEAILQLSSVDSVDSAS